jgi:hypothetical protein
MSALLRILLTPALIGSASLIGRRFGPTVSGWLVGLPFTSGPTVFILALDHGSTFAAAAAAGTLSGALSEIAFCLIYSWLAFYGEWWLATTAAISAFAIVTFLLQFLTFHLLLPLFLVVVLGLSLALVLARRLPGARVGEGKAGSRKSVEQAVRPPAWDLPVRMIVATVFVLLLTSLAPVFGPTLAGLLATFPLYASILTIFAHRQQGSAAAAGVLRGLLLGLYAFASFFFVLALLLTWVGIPPAFLAAILVTLLVQGGTLWIIQNRRLS